MLGSISVWGAPAFGSVRASATELRDKRTKRQACSSRRAARRRSHDHEAQSGKGR
jgi:hypothetical protein